jgi:hypothetical protein
MANGAARSGVPAVRIATLASDSTFRVTRSAAGSLQS